MNKYLNLDQQIVHLFVDKSVMFELSEIDIVKKILYDNNYLNFVSCSKVKFAELIDKHLMMYKTASFKDWQAYFEIDCYVSDHLKNNMTVFERALNSRISDYISNLMANDGLSNFEKNEIIVKVRQNQNRKGVNFSKYNGDRSWFYISEMTFGGMKQLLYWMYDNRRNDYFDIVRGFTFLNKQVRNRIDELNILRNTLFHNKPITVYLTAGNIYKNENVRDRMNAVKWISEVKIHQSMRALVTDVCDSSQRFIDIKNSLLRKK